MKKNYTRVVLLSISFLISVILNAQLSNNIWYFGENAGIDFSSGIPVALSNDTTSTI